MIILDDEACDARDRRAGRGARDAVPEPGRPAIST